MPVPTATIMMATADELLRLVRLSTWLSPAFPIGGFAYSHGLEWGVEGGDISDEAMLRGWVADVLSHGTGRSDAILLRHAHSAQPDHLPALCELGIALTFGRERRLETCAQGAAFVRGGIVWGGPRIIALADTQAPYPVAVGALAADHGIEADLAAAAYLQAFASSLVSAAVRLIPLGQTAGLKVVAALEPVIVQITERTRNAGLEEVGGACFRSDIAALRHETQHTRLFRT